MWVRIIFGLLFMVVLVVSMVLVFCVFWVVLMLVCDCILVVLVVFRLVWVVSRVVCVLFNFLFDIEFDLVRVLWCCRLIFVCFILVCVDSNWVLVCFCLVLWVSIWVVRLVLLVK